MPRATAKPTAIDGVFAALGDSTRLEIIQKLLDGSEQSISNLAKGFSLTRQGISRHLDVLTRSGIIARNRIGRETRYRLQQEQLNRAAAYLAQASSQWDDALTRLSTHIE